MWHNIALDIPLELSAVGACHDIRHLSGSHIKRLVLDALRLDENWRKEDPKIRRIRRIDIGDPVIQMQPLGRQWVVTLTKTNRTTDFRPVYQISILKLRDDNSSTPTAVAKFDTTDCCSFSASLQDSGNTILLCFCDVKIDKRHRRQVIVYPPLQSVDSNQMQTRGYHTLHRCTRMYE